MRSGIRYPISLLTLLGTFGIGFDPKVHFGLRMSHYGFIYIHTEGRRWRHPSNWLTSGYLLSTLLSIPPVLTGFWHRPKAERTEPINPRISGIHREVGAKALPTRVEAFFNCRSFSTFYYYLFLSFDRLLLHIGRGCGKKITVFWVWMFPYWTLLLFSSFQSILLYKCCSPMCKN